MPTARKKSARLMIATGSEDPSGKLELTWPDKHRTLLTESVGGKPHWVDAGHWRAAEVRLLAETNSVGQLPGDPHAANLLITGDSLAALRSLLSITEYKAEHAGKVKLAYLDPPFNTGQAFAHYDDGVEHTTWLTMMRDRLVLIEQLLSPDGTVWVHLDDNEMAYCRVLMDEIFGRENFVATIVWKKADSPRNSAKHFSTDQDYIHVYAKDAPAWRPNRLGRTDQTDAAYTNPDNDPRGPWTPGDPFANKPYALGSYEVTGPTGNRFGPPPGRYWCVSEETFRELDRTGQIYWRGGGEARPRIKRYLASVGDLVPRTAWDYTEVGSSGTGSREIRKLFPDRPVFATPKPEALLERVLAVASKPGDLVLDCFAGSGTTAAVAHKMGRRWVTVEQNPDTVATFTAPRLTMVVEGRDSGGVTSSNGWAGGGGFRSLTVQESMFEEHERNLFLRAQNETLKKAVAAQFGFRFELGSGVLCGRAGQRRLAVLPDLQMAVARRLLNEVEQGQSVAVYVEAQPEPDVDEYVRKERPGSTVEMIPQAITRAYGHSLAPTAKRTGLRLLSHFTSTGIAASPQLGTER